MALITLAQAEAAIITVVANRTALAASARTLTAPTALAAAVRGALVTAMDYSLTDDQDISTCLKPGQLRHRRLHLPGLSHVHSPGQPGSRHREAVLPHAVQPATSVHRPATDQPQF